MSLKSRSFNPSNVSITGGTITGTNVPYVLSQSAIPFIFLSSGSVSAAGAISAITALPLTYAKAYCYFPANILATSIAAGWHYCTFSNTTAGTAFLDTYTSGTPTIPSSPTAVTDGKGAFTGATTEVTAQIITVPANALGANGLINSEVLFSFTNNSNTKTPRLRYSGGAGTAYFGVNVTTQGTVRPLVRIQNRGATNSQVGGAAAFTGASAVTVADQITSAIDTTASSTIATTVTKSTATDNLIVDSYTHVVAFSS